MIHKTCVGILWFQLWGEKKNWIVIGEYSTFTEQCYPINSFFFFFFVTKENPLCTLMACLGGAGSGPVPQGWETGHRRTRIHSISLTGLEFSHRSKIPSTKLLPAIPHSGSQRDRRPSDDPGLLVLHQRNIGPQERLRTPSGSTQRGLGGHAVLPKRSHGQAKAMGHQGSPRTSDVWDRATLLYRPSCPGYFTAEPDTAPSPELDSRDELTCSSSKHDNTWAGWFGSFSFCSFFQSTYLLCTKISIKLGNCMLMGLVQILFAQVVILLLLLCFSFFFESCKWWLIKLPPTLSGLIKKKKEGTPQHNII